MITEPLFSWQEAALEFAGFVASFLATGAVGFRFAVERGRGAQVESGASGESLFYAQALRKAALLGLIGSVVSGIFLVSELPASAEEAHTSVAGLLTTNMMAASQVALLVAGIAGLALAWRGVRAGWILALIGFAGSPLRGVFTGNLVRIVTPAHQMFAGLWIGTLFILLVAGIGTLMRNESVRTRRGLLAAEMVNSFSPLALFASAGVAFFGVITAWRHLHVLSNLWETPYGLALVRKLIFVAAVVGLGAWNWRRQRAKLGSDEALQSIRRSAGLELAVATVVLVLTGILVSIPAPRPPGELPSVQVQQNP